ncbi:MAG TPA: TetR/AcrR family transcriptional regulator [Ilumatobacteraceae bacterium]|jgi:AcrR family transcriptional regulator
MDASVRLFARQGFTSTSVQEIVAEAELTKGAFYHHFAAKDDVLLEIHDEFIESLLRRTYDVLAQGFGARRTIEMMIGEMMVSFEEYNDEVSVFFRERRSLSDEASVQVRAKRDEYEHLIVRVLEQGIRSGEFRPLPHVRLAAFGIVGMCIWAQEWFDPKGPVRARDLAELYSKMVMEGLVATTA